MATIVKYQDNKLSLGDDVTIDQAKSALSAIYPEVANAEGTREEDGSIVFRVQSGTKGADSLKVIYGETEITLPASTDNESARTALAGIHPEIANAEAVRDDEAGTLKFVVKSGTKG